MDKIMVERLWRTLKYEEIYLKDYETVDELIKGLREYFWSYNNERTHQGPGGNGLDIGSILTEKEYKPDC